MTVTHWPGGPIWKYFSLYSLILNVPPPLCVLSAENLLQRVYVQVIRNRCVAVYEQLYGHFGCCAVLDFLFDY